MIPVIEGQSYKAERNKILLDMKKYYQEQGDDYVKILGQFVGDLTSAINSIQKDPCRYPD